MSNIEECRLYGCDRRLGILKSNVGSEEFLSGEYESESYEGRDDDLASTGKLE